MRILIQNIRTKNFLQTPNNWLGDREPIHWVSEREKATDFECTFIAHQFCCDKKLGHVQFVLDFGKPEFEIILPFDEKL